MPAFAQKAEVGVFAGWVFSDGVAAGTNYVVPGVGTFNRVDPKDSFGWGSTSVSWSVPTRRSGSCTRSSPRSSRLAVQTTKDIGDLSTHTYHGTYTYNFGERDSKIGNLIGGLGGTSYGDTNYTRANGVTGTISGQSRFSSTWGAGVKVYGAGKVGGRVGLRWTPTYIKSDAAGWWCDPAWGAASSGARSIRTSSTSTAASRSASDVCARNSTSGSRASLARSCSLKTR